MPFAQFVEDLDRQRIRINFQTERQGSSRTDARADSAKLSSFDRLVKLESVAPERLVAIGIVAEDIAPVLEDGGSVHDNGICTYQRSLRMRFWRLSANPRAENTAGHGGPADVDEVTFLRHTHKFLFRLFDLFLWSPLKFNRRGTCLPA